jgi:hypothetical protein
MPPVMITKAMPIATRAYGALPNRKATMLSEPRKLISW